MARYCRCFVLNVGQGSSTFMVVYSDASGSFAPVMAVLADFRSASFNVFAPMYAPAAGAPVVHANATRAGRARVLA